ncbi:MAG: DUF4230 domain-containing protein, partial [Bacteroidota bacterium]
MNLQTFLQGLLIGLVVGALACYGLLQLLNADKKEDEPKTRNFSYSVLKEIEALGRLELLRYEFDEVVSHERMRDWLPNPQVILFARGEAIGCVDLQQVDSSRIQLVQDTLVVQLPRPEICQLKLNHQQSRVFDARYAYFQEADLVQEAYRKAEAELEEAALEWNLLEQTEIQARV